MTTVNSVAPDTVAATLTLAGASNNGVANQPSSATLTYTCDKASVFYYALSTSNTTLTSMTATSIKTATLDAG